LAILVSGANRHDSKMFERCVNAVHAIKKLPSRPCQRPTKLHADKGYDYRRCRAHLRQKDITSRIARRGVESSERLGKYRWIVERTHAWFAGFGKLRIRFKADSTSIERCCRWRQPSSSRASSTGGVSAS
jgi:hypothetical protein